MPTKLYSVPFGTQAASGPGRGLRRTTSSLFAALWRRSGLAVIRALRICSLQCGATTAANAPVTASSPLYMPRHVLPGAKRIWRKSKRILRQNSTFPLKHSTFWICTNPMTACMRKMPLPIRKNTFCLTTPSCRFVTLP